MKIVRGYTSLGTFGEWYSDEGELICISMEKPWVDNIPYDSCVPEGEYGIQEYSSPKFGNTYCIVNHYLEVGMYEGDAGEDTRYAILIHPANWVAQLNGCIAPGSSLTVLDNRWAVSASRVAMNKVFELIEAGDSELVIEHATALLPEYN